MPRPTPAELAATLEAHRKWTNGKPEGVRADLSGADLSGADLRGADLSDAYLRDAYLSDAYLSDANLAGTCVELLLDNDGRGYQVVAHRGLTSDGEALYLAGCRQLALAGARKHWGNPNHPNPEAAARILAAIEAHQNTL